MKKHYSKPITALTTFFIGIGFVFLWQCTTEPIQIILPQKQQNNLKISVAKSEITDEDKRQIIISILNWYSSVESSKKPKTFYLSTTNIPESMVKQFPQIKNAKIVFLTTSGSSFARYVNPTETQQYNIGKFSEFRVIENKVNVSYTTYFEGGNSGGTKFEFIKESGKWKGKIIGGFAAAS